MLHCPYCGAKLGHRSLEGRTRAICTACDKVHYDQLKVGAGVLIEQGGRLLLLKRRHQPFEGLR